MLSVSIKPYLPYLCLAGLAGLLYLSPAFIQTTLEYDRTALAQGQIWRVISGHLIHSNFYHLLMNLIGLILIMLIYAPLSQRLALGWQWVLLSLSTSASLWLFSDDISVYVGMSGVLHGILCFGAILDLRQGFRTGYLILAGVAVKLIVEQVNGPDSALAAQIAANVAIDAHLYGALGGMILAMVCFYQTPRPLNVHRQTDKPHNS
ncbi:rhombosortase [Alishewanella tabrizica]|uniref:Peptidase S54 rhomboid domain-containing protein n=1 Tax=Alishewanella tabrizica TaxID=671278 RepID=A0ABQ2WK16_9ALTE|nr:rhombosortase [Alishewanella tabrizica]GGW59454.1 hypothetical protein GCM10008111_14430 [Alishewanella tabrizica]